jgi:hypothetical protein
MIYLNSNSTVSNPDIGFAFNYNDGVYRHGGFFRDASDNGTFKVFDNYSPEPDANIFIDTAHASFRLANIAATTFFGNVTGTVGTLSNFTTANLAEGINLYYTNARVISAVTPYLTTANVLESNSNLYYTNARVLSALSGNLVVGNLVTGTSVSNSYVTTGNVTAGNVIATGTLTFGSGAGGIIAGANLLSANNIQSINWLGLYSANVIESNSALYYTNARVYSNVIAALAGNVAIGNATIGNVIAAGAVFGSGGGGSIVGANLLSANNIQGINWLGLYTSNVIEGTNQYFTNARVYSNVIALLPTLAGSGIQIQANGQINANAQSLSLATLASFLTTSNVSEGSNLYYTNARVLSALTGNLVVGNLVTGTSVSNSYVTTGNVNAGNIVANTLLIGTGSGGSLTGLNLISATNIQASNINSGNVIATTLVLGSATGGFITGANLLSANNIQGINWLGLYTSNVIEGSNQYFTNVRVYSNVIALLPTLAGSGIQIQANGQINATASGASITSTSNVSEGSNLYYTNARVLSALTGNVTIGNLVTGTSVSNSYVTTGNVTAGNIIATGTVLFGSGGGGSIVGANLLSANNIQGINWLGLYTPNVIESSSALYYTNTRVNSNVIAFLPSLAGSGIQIQANGQINATASALTSNVNIGNLVTGTSVSNSYVTTGNINAGNIIANTLVIGSASGGSLTGLNLISATNIETNSITSSNVNSGNVIATTLVLGSATGGSVTGANLLSANNIQGINWIGLYSANVIENTNLYFTNARVFANVIALLPTLAGSGIQIQANGQINATASGASITSTSNVSEGSNLYYTNTRVLSALTGNVTIGNLVTDTSISNSYVTAGNINAGNIVATGIAFFGSGAGGSVTGANLISASNIQTNNITTVNVTAGNVIANTAFFGSGVGGSLTGANLISANNIVANTASFGSGTGGSVTGANLISATNIQANSWLGLYTSNVIENTNLYFTNARVYSNVIALLPSLAGSGIQIEANGQINATASATSGFASTSNVANTVLSISNFTTANLAEGSNLYYTNTRVLSALTGNVTIGNATIGSVVANTAFFGSGVGGSVTGANLISANNIVANTAFFGSGAGGSMTGANLISANNIQGINWLGLYTANVIETAGNLYFTNARVVSALSTDATIVIEANGQIRSNTSAGSGTVSLDGLTTANLAEGSNLYYTNARVLSALTGNITVGNLTATSIVINTSVANSYTTTGNVYAGNLIANGLIIRNITVQDSALTGSTSANNIVADSITSNSYTTTGNIIASNVIAGNVFANGLILRNITILGTGIYRPYIATFKGNSQVTTLNLPVTPANNNYVTVIINGVTQLSNAYTLSGNVITLSGAPATNADIDVRIVEVEQTVTKDFNSRLFYGNSVANTTLISSNFTDSSILVFENGVAQVPGIDYSVNNGLLRFTTPPRTGVTVEIRELPTLFGTGTYLGGKNTEILANGQINSNITVGQNLTISANGQINATVQEQIHPFLLSLL